MPIRTRRLTGWSLIVLSKQQLKWKRRAKLCHLQLFLLEIIVVELHCAYLKRYIVI
ncbi:hypothetical protein PS906_03232 [Pseudomonas fluorescens]|nr:hypothetical protein PS906_03232 [Pseudomonas fluorescens]